MVVLASDHTPCIAPDLCLADRLSKVVDVPVAPDDGLTKFICGICNRKFCQQTLQIDNCTEPLSDSSNDQGQGTTDGPGDQERDVIGAPNVSQTPVEVTEARTIVLDPCDNTTEDAMAAPTSVKISVYSPRNGVDVITVVSREYEKIVKAMAGGNMKSICRAFFANPHLRQEAVSKVSVCIESVLSQDPNVMATAGSKYLSIKPVTKLSILKIVLQFHVTMYTLVCINRSFNRFPVNSGPSLLVISASSTTLLDVVLQRTRSTIVDDVVQVLEINPHTKCHCCKYYS
ncbi:hypothetical protein EMCRGX_G010154 [Ephydatia muelleri]